MSWKTRFILFSLLLGFFLASSPTRLSAQGEFSIQGSVEDAETGKPIPGAIVVVCNLWGLKQIVRTHANGTYSASVMKGNPYRLYVYTPGFDYVPVKSVVITPTSDQPVTELSFKLLPGAPMLLYGRIYFVHSISFPTTFEVEVVDPTGTPLTQDSEGANFTNIYKWDQTERFYLGFNRSLVVVPALKTVDLKVSSYATVRRGILQPRYIEKTHFLVDNDGAHYNLSQGTLVSGDLSWYSLGKSVQIARQEWEDTMSKLGEMENAGFYVGLQKEKMLEALNNIERANELRRQGKYEKSIGTLATAYGTVTVFVIYDLTRMWLIAKSSAVVMPLFPAFFAVTMGFFLFEEIRRKIMASCILYIASTAVLYFVYPGFQVVEVNLLLALTSSIFIIVLFAVFGLPRLIKEPDIPGPYPFRAILSVVFSMGKRNVKRRLSRGVLTIASLTVLVLAFTTFTSFGRALGLLTTLIPDFQPPSEGVLIKNLPPPWVEYEALYLTIPEADIDWLKEHEATQISPLVWSKPQTQYIGVLGKGGNELQIFGILGVNSSEASITLMNQVIQNGDLSQLENPDGAIISEDAAGQLGAQRGSILPFFIRTAGGLQLQRNLTIVGIIDDDGASNLKDLNGESLLPLKMVTQDDKLVNATCAASEVLVLNWRTALNIAGDITSISRIAFQIENPEEFAKTIVWQKEYTVWISANGKVTKYHFGEYLEIGGITLLFPLIIVLLNVGLVMISIVSERTREIFTLTCVGFNPTHIATLFLAESVVMGMVGGCLGYLLGMGSYRLMTLFNVNIAVRQKLEWYWSAAGVLLSVGVAVLSAVRPALRAVAKATPSLVKRVKLPEKEKIKREEEVWKVFQSQRISMPVRISEREALFFSSYLFARMQELEEGLLERVENYQETEEETPEGDQIKRFTFTYIFVEEDKPELVTINELEATKKSGEDYYHLSLISEPKTSGLPGTFLDRTIRFIRGILDDWEKEKANIMG